MERMEIISLNNSLPSGFTLCITMSATKLPTTLNPFQTEKKDQLTIEVTKSAGHFVTKSDVSSCPQDIMTMTTILNY